MVSGPPEMAVSTEEGKEKSARAMSLSMGAASTTPQARTSALFRLK